MCEHTTIITMPEDNTLKYHQLIHAELDRCQNSINALTQRIRDILPKLSQILLKFDCLPLDQSNKLPSLMYTYKITNIMYKLVDMVEKQGQFGEHLLTVADDCHTKESFDEYLSLARMRTDWLKTVSRRLTAVAEKIAHVFGEVADVNVDMDEEEDTTETEDEMDGSFVSAATKQ